MQPPLPVLSLPLWQPSPSVQEVPDDGGSGHHGQVLFGREVKAWLAMLANVSVGYTPQRIDIFVCRRHVGNVVLTRRQHSVMLANFLAVGIVLETFIPNTLSYMYVGISRVLVRG